MAGSVKIGGVQRSVLYRATGGGVGIGGVQRSVLYTDTQPLTMEVSLSPAGGDEGAAVDYQAAMSAATTGTVQFYVDGVATGGPVPLVAATTATLSTTFPAAGSHQLSAGFVSDAGVPQTSVSVGFVTTAAPAPSGGAGAQIHPPFDEPYFLGDSESQSAGLYLLPVGLDGREFLVDTASRLFERRHINLLRTRQNRAPQDTLLIEPEIWRTVVESWHQGADQSRSDREESLPYRFSASRNIDVWQEWGIGLLHATEEIATWTAKQYPPLAAVLGHKGVLVLSGTEVRWWPDMDADPDDFLSSSVSSPCLSLTNNGEKAYSRHANGEVLEWETPIAGSPTPTVFATLPSGLGEVWYLKGFLVASDGNSLYDISGGTPALIYQHPLVDWRWVAAADGSGYSYLLGGIGDKWFVQKMRLLEDATTFGPPSTAATLPEGEIGFGLGGYLGYILIGTDHGVRFAAPQGDGSLLYGKLVETPNPVRCFEGQDRFVWFGLDASAAARLIDAGSVALGRMDLSTFVEPLVPAAASDLTTPNESGSVWSVATIGSGAGRRIFTTDTGMWIESTLLAEEGWLEQGILNLDTVDPKRAQYAQLTFLPLEGQIELAFAWDGGLFQTAVITSVPGAVESGNVLLDGRRFVGIRPRYTLRRDTEDPTLGPRLTRFELRAQAELGKAHEWTVPLIVAETIDHLGVTQNRNVVEDFNLLTQLVETGRTFTYREGAQTWSVYAVGERWLPTHQTRDGRAWNGVYVISLREVR